MGGLSDFIFGGDEPQAPDYSPVANASVEAAKVSAEQADRVLAEGKRQYDANMEVVKPVVDAQLQIMKQNAQQGADLAEYQKTGRPLEQQMLQQAAGGTEQQNQALRDQIQQKGVSDAKTLADRTAAYEAETKADIDMATGGNAAIAAKYGADVEGDVGTAVADARMGQTQALNTAMRQAIRYGLSVPSNVQTLTNQNAATLAATANTARKASIDQIRARVRDGIGLKQGAFATGQAATVDAMSKGDQALTNGRNMKIQDESLDWGRKLDATGMVRGLTGASQGAYSVATNAGNSASQNQMASGASLLDATKSAAATTMNGQQLAMQGLTSILGTQANAYSTATNAQVERQKMTMDLIGTGAGLAMSDSRLKRDIVKVADDPRGFGWYTYEYVWGGGRQLGVMAQEVERIIPAAVVEIGGFKAVDYRMI